MTVRPNPDTGKTLVEVQYACPRSGVPGREALSAWAEAACRAVHKDSAEVTLRVTGTQEMQDLNRDYRGMDKPTNVLSFSIDSPSNEVPGILGDIVICRDIVLAEAEDQGKESDAHWAHMVIHGVLHLCGYDHERSVDAVEMESLETEILAKLGFPNPW